MFFKLYRSYYLDFVLLYFFKVQKQIFFNVVYNLNILGYISYVNKIIMNINKNIFIKIFYWFNFCFFCFKYLYFSFLVYIILKKVYF